LGRVEFASIHFGLAKQVENASNYFLAPAINGAVKLQVAGASGLGQLIFRSSTNLLGWENITTQGPVIGNLEYLSPDSESWALLSRFRIVLEQRAWIPTGSDANVWTRFALQNLQLQPEE